MSETQGQRSYSMGAVATLAIATGCITWLCIGLFGSLSPLTAAVAVMLVEVFLACIGVMAMLLAARLSDTYLQLESRIPERPARPQRLWLWRPIWQPVTQSYDGVQQPASIALTPVDDWLQSVHDEMRPLDDVDEPPATLPFPISGSAEQSSHDRHTGDTLQHRRAA